MEPGSASEPEKCGPLSCFKMSTLAHWMDVLGVSLEDPKFLAMPLVLVICHKGQTQQGLSAEPDLGRPVDGGRMGGC